MSNEQQFVVYWYQLAHNVYSVGYARIILRYPINNEEPPFEEYTVSTNLYNQHLEN